MCLSQDPNAEHVEVSDWNKYAEEEYDILVADEGNADLEDGWVTTFYFVVEDEGLSQLGFSNKQSCSLKKKDPASITDLWLIPEIDLISRWTMLIFQSKSCWCGLFEEQAYGL